MKRIIVTHTNLNRLEVFCATSASTAFLVIAIINNTKISPKNMNTSNKHSEDGSTNRSARKPRSGGGRYPWSCAVYDPAEIRVALKRVGDCVRMRLEDLANADRWEEIDIPIEALLSLLGLDRATIQSSPASHERDKTT